MFRSIQSAVIIYNPQAGSVDSVLYDLQLFLGIRTKSPALNFTITECMNRIVYTLAAMDVDIQIAATEYKGHATELARMYASTHDVIVVIGGDGTINEVVNGMIGTNALLAILPFGTSNVLSLELQLPNSLKDFCAMLESQFTVKPIDLGRCNDRYFTCMAGIGLDAYIIRHTNLGLKKRFGALSYIMTFLRSFWNYRWRKIDIKVGHTTTHQTGYFAIVGNSHYYGGSLVVADRAQLTDGKLDICLFKSAGATAFLRYLVSTIRGKISRQSDIDYIQASHFDISSKHPFSVHVDGDYFCRLPVTISVVPSALNVITPTIENSERT